MSQRPARFDTGGASAEEIAAWEAEHADDAVPVDTPVEDTPPVYVDTRDD
jgi:hypothetical protein